MPALDTPPGLRLRTGVLLSSVTVNLADTVTGSPMHRVDLGPGFAIGIHGVQLRIGPLGAVTNDTTEYALVLDPDVTTIPASGDGRAALRYVVSTTVIATATGTAIAFGDRTPLLWIPGGPVFTVRNFVSVFANDSGSTADFEARVFYSIYEVTDAEFLRIAGVSLSRG